MKETTSDKILKNAEILTFSRRRGRPKTNRPSIDTGTPETVMKRLLGVTTEALDLCLQRNIITEKQHWCGIHLRWLYTLRHGVPSVRATDLSYIGGYEQKSSEYEDPLWRAAREKEYNTAVSLLNQSGYALLVINLCIYNEYPKSLQYSAKKLHKVDGNTRKLCDGLDILAKLWNRS